MWTYPLLHIVTGPPGSGKTTFATSLSKEKVKEGDSTNRIYLPIYDHDLGNKRDFITVRPQVEAVLCAAAPSARNKDYWIQHAKSAGYIPKLYVMWIPRMEAYLRMRKRSGLSKTQQNDLQSGVELWYRTYSRHPKEIRIEDGRPID